MCNLFANCCCWFWSDRKNRDMSFAYFNKIIDTLETCPELKRTFLGVAKQVGYTACVGVAGGFALGPLGALIGSAIGAFFGYLTAEDYNSLVRVVKNLSDEEKCRLELKVQELVGSHLVEDLVNFVKVEVNRQLLLNAIGEQFQLKDEKSTEKSHQEKITQI